MINKIETFSRWVNKLFETKTDFPCQREYELETKCLLQCDHCKGYYKSLMEQ